ncbi:hypothetical protein GPECTOR_36g135 [Gonium pectorale]|uniref:RAP domain-containing protein n=1 Tax=Gonium pectorale TaxID=33097 RepID=A0A150GBS4_GONPE|nr:hypothetical protein GPECTOR_36g135 [Gonium pectorale]|eukprot:KXZ47284.1 hypothetical protein GPECTOR_36g135 [Gonium pectorale]
MHCCPNVLEEEAEEPPGMAGGTAGTAEGGNGEGEPPEEEEEERGARLRLRLRGPALAELRCLASWGWRVLVVPVGLWAELDTEQRAEWLARRLQEVAAGDAAGSVLGPDVLL